MKVASPLFESDALMLPLRDESLDLITIAFGFRNLANYQRGLEELLRVLKPGGMVAILEFSQPRNRAFAALYGFFSTRVLPWSRRNDLWLARCLFVSAGVDPQVSVRLSNWPRKCERWVSITSNFERMTGGAVALHVGQSNRSLTRAARFRPFQSRDRQGVGSA